MLQVAWLCHCQCFNFSPICCCLLRVLRLDAQSAASANRATEAPSYRVAPRPEGNIHQQCFYQRCDKGDKGSCALRDATIVYMLVKCMPMGVAAYICNPKYSGGGDRRRKGKTRIKERQSAKF